MIIIARWILIPVRERGQQYGLEEDRNALAEPFDLTLSQEMSELPSRRYPCRISIR